jgi:hypothetical protein
MTDKVSYPPDFLDAPVWQAAIKKAKTMAIIEFEADAKRFRRLLKCVSWQQDAPTNNSTSFKLRLEVELPFEWTNFTSMHDAFRQAIDEMAGKEE